MKVWKTTFITLLLLAACAPRTAAQAQAQAPPANLFHLGSVDVSVPPPAGFVEASSRSSVVKELFLATESTQLDLLAVHVPADEMERISRGEYRGLEFYAKVSVSKALRVTNSTREDYAKFIAYLRSNSSKVFDLKSPRMREQLRHQNEGLTEVLKEKTTVDFSQPVNIGEIEDTPDSHGLMMLMKVAFQSGAERKEKMVVAGVSSVLVKNRIVFTYTYRDYKSESDADELRAFTKRWLAEILRANP